MFNHFHAYFAASNRANKIAMKGVDLVGAIVGFDLQNHQHHATDGRTGGADALIA